MRMDHNTALAKYEQELDKALSSECVNAQRQAVKLYQLVVYILKTAQRSGSSTQTDEPLHWLLEILKTKFKDLSTCATVSQTGKMRSWEVFTESYYSYMSKLANLSEVVYYIDAHCRKSGRGKNLMSLLQDFYLEQAFDMSDTLLRSYREVCEEFISGKKDCTDHLLLIHNATCKYLMSAIDSPNIRANANTKKFFNMGATCMREWVSNTPKRGFIESWRVYQNTLELHKIIGQEQLGESGLELFYNSEGKLFMESLNDLVLSSDLLNVICEADNQNSSQWLKFVSHFFKNARPIKLERYDFDKLLTSILLNDFFSANTYAKNSGNCIIMKEMRDEFKESIENKKEFHTKLLNYMHLKFRKDYQQRRVSHMIPNSADDILWINAIVSLIVHYVPDLPMFLNLYLRQGLFRQMVMLNSNFSTFLNEPDCLERVLIKELNMVIPSDMYFIRSLLSISPGTSDENLKLKNNSPEFNRLYISKELASELSLTLSNGMDPIWPAKSIEYSWKDELQNYQNQGKKLHGLFSIHVMTVSTPIVLSNGKNLNLIGDLTMASVLYLFNDSDTITRGGILKKLGNKNVNYVEATINKLSQHKILARGDSNQFKINMRYEASSKVLSSGILKII